LDIPFSSINDDSEKLLFILHQKLEFFDPSAKKIDFQEEIKFENYDSSDSAHKIDEPENDEEDVYIVPTAQDQIRSTKIV
jgi:hypothetical protein